MEGSNVELHRLEDYGRVFRRYVGEGHMRSDGDVFPLTVEIGVLHDAQIFLIFEGKVPAEVLWDPPTPTLLSTTGQPTAIDRLDLVHATSQVDLEHPATAQCQLVCRATNLHVGEWHNAPAEVRYYLTNLKICRSYQWELDGYRIQIERLPTYKEELRVMQASRHESVTCLVRVSRLNSDSVDLGATNSLVTDLAMLLSLARGTCVSWVMSECQYAESVFTYHRDAKLSTYSALQIIPHNPPGDLESFVRLCYPVYRTLKTEWGLQEAIWNFTNGLSENDYLELRTLKLATLLDYLRGRFAESYDQGGHLVEPDQFGLRKRHLQDRVKAALREVFPDYPVAVTGEMSQHVAGMFRRSFQSSLRRMLNHLNLNIDSEELRRFVDIRNRVVHEARFLPKETYGSPWSQYASVLSILSRVFLAILRFQGHYYDWARHVPGESEGSKMTGRVKFSVQ